MTNYIKKTREEYAAILWANMKDMDLNTEEGKMQFVEQISGELYSLLEMYAKMTETSLEFTKMFTEAHSKTSSALQTLIEKINTGNDNIRKEFDRLNDIVVRNGLK